jgi:hypothetical protein
MAAGRPKKSFLLRIDPELWAELEAMAARELRSVNGQIEYMLRESLRRRGRDRGLSPRGVEDGPADG